jgi:hypothetical protein
VGLAWVWRGAWHRPCVFAASYHERATLLPVYVVAVVFEIAWTDLRCCACAVASAAPPRGALRLLLRLPQRRRRSRRWPRRRPRLLLRRLWPRLLRLLLQRGGRRPRLLPRRPLPPRRLPRLLPRRWRHRFLLSGSAKRALLSPPHLPRSNRHLRRRSGGFRSAAAGPGTTTTFP